MKKKERGAAALEFSLIAGMLFLLLFGIVEMGLAWRAKHTINDAANRGVRSLAIGSNSASADYSALQAVERALDTSSIDVELIVIFEADFPEDLPSASCMAGSVSSGSDPCNVYTMADFARLETDFGCKPSSPDRYYCPTTRSSVVGTLDLVGVWVKGGATSFTGVVPAYEFAAHSVLAVEPTSGA